MSAYRIEVRRRDSASSGYETEPYCATAFDASNRLVAVQFGSQAGLAFQRAWNVVQDDREREGVVSNG